jgi:8-oxo-dGTP pyrophosphatase MutT (NUDIX family)
MSRLRLCIAKKQPITITAPTFLNKIRDMLPSLVNNQALANSGISTQTEQISNAIEQLNNNQDPERIKSQVNRINSALRPILTSLQKIKTTQETPSADIMNAIEQINMFGNEIAKWNKSVGVVPSKPPQAGEIVNVPKNKPFATRMEGSPQQPMSNMMAPRSPSEWQEAQKGEKATQPATQPQTATPDEVESAAEEVQKAAAIKIKETKMASKDKRIDKSDNKWVGLFETTDGYVYASELRGGSIVAVLGYKETDEGILFVGRFESVPCHDDKMKLVSLTGMMEEGEDPKEAAVREMAEESGVEIDKDDLIDLGTVKPAKAMDTTFYLFGVDIGDKTPEKGPGDGSSGEKGTYCKLVPMRDIVKSDNSILHSLLVRILEYID